MTTRQVINELFKCNVLAPTEDNFEKLEFNAADPTEIERRVSALQHLLQLGTTGAAKKTTLDQSTISVINTRNMVRVGEAVRSAVLDPDAVRGANRALARDYGVVQQWLGMGDEYTQQGWVRESLNRIQRLYRGGMRETLVRMGVNQTIKEEYEPLLRQLRGLGLRQDQIDRITTNAVELGYLPFLQDAQSLAPRGRQILIDRYNTYIKEMRDLHIPQNVIDNVLAAGHKVAATNHRIAVIAADAGINLPETPLMGYFPRVMSDQAQQRFNWKWRDEHTVTWNTGADSAITEAFLKGRSTSEYIVEDEVILDYLLRNLGRADHDDPLYYYKLVEGESIGDLLNSKYGLATAVKEMLERNHPQVFEAMINSGLLSKVPFSTVEVFDYIRDTLKFPFDNLREVFATDWRTAMRVYETQLAEVAAQSGFVNKIVAEASSGTWGVTAAQRFANPKQYEGWVPLRAVIDPRIMGKTLQDRNPVLGDIFVHPVAAELAKAAQDLQMNPQHLGALAQVFRNINRSFRQLAVMTLEYIPRQVWQVGISTLAAGGNIATLPAYASKMILYEIMSHKGMDASRLFDKVKPAIRRADGTIMTEWEAFNWAMSTGIVTRFDPVQGQLNPGNYAHRTNVTQQLRYLGHTLSEEGIPRTLEEASSVLTGLVDKIYYPFAVTNNIMNNAASFNALMSVTRRQRNFDEAIRVGGNLASLSTKTFETADEAVEHLKHFFFMYDDFTYNDRNIRNFVIPFWGFLSKNIPAAVRYAVRHPSRFYAHQQLYALANSPVQDDELISEGTVDEWSLYANPIYFRVPSLTGGRDSYFVLPMESIDPINSGINWVSQPGEAILEMFGIWNEHRVRTTRERLEQQPGSTTRTNQLINEMLGETFPIWKAIASEIRGEDMLGRPLEEGARINEYLGLRMAPRTAMWLETLIPLLGSINRLNPGGVLGTPSRYDPFTGEWTLGRDSWAGVPRSSRDTFQTNNPYEHLRYIGVKIYPLDVYLNMGHTYDSLSVSLSNTRRLLARMREDLPRLSPELRAQREQEIAEIVYIYEQTQADLEKFKDFMKRQGLSPHQAYDRLRGANIRIGDLEDVDTVPQQSEPESTEPSSPVRR